MQKYHYSCYNNNNPVQKQKETKNANKEHMIFDHGVRPIVPMSQLQSGCSTFMLIKLRFYTVQLVFTRLPLNRTVGAFHATAPGRSPTNIWARAICPLISKLWAIPIIATRSLPIICSTPNWQVLFKRVIKRRNRQIVHTSFLTGIILFRFIRLEIKPE
jgi:hypothetical protein